MSMSPEVVEVLQQHRRKFLQAGEGAGVRWAAPTRALVQPALRPDTHRE
jgi:hypothetical protein